MGYLFVDVGSITCVNIIRKTENIEKTDLKNISFEISEICLNVLNHILYTIEFSAKLHTSSKKIHSME